MDRFAFDRSKPRLHRADLDLEDGASNKSLKDSIRKDRLYWRIQTSSTLQRRLISREEKSSRGSIGSKETGLLFQDNHKKWHGSTHSYGMCANGKSFLVNRVHRVS
ncbi:hypothetical protein Nepgr_024756 [Nepenthes gracilis]|uniref:Uncharacterized protein n=1 Tax=Nepenthes gracilis TaxID=150966 RepID=A0AAD3T4U7_NEPGR|nr:hypothetical protein Nepgr_024756 [Nepenthes gracilis]